MPVDQDIKGSTGEDHLSPLISQGARMILLIERVAADELVIAGDPEITRLGNAEIFDFGQLPFLRNARF